MNLSALWVQFPWVAALFAGLISFLSPCVLPLVPPYLAYLAGASAERLADAEPPALVKRDVIFAEALFVLRSAQVTRALGVQPYRGPNSWADARPRIPLRSMRATG